MKVLSFRNSSKLITSLLQEETVHAEDYSYYDEDLQFSTFRSDDYQFQSYFIGRKKEENDHYNQSFVDSSFEDMLNDYS